MSAQDKTQFTNSKIRSNFAPTLVPRSLLQRKCACGTHTMGGRECADCAKKKTGLQRKLVIGASNDPLEQEADRVAEQVMAGPAPSHVKLISPRIQRFTGQSTGQMDVAPDSVDRVLASSGRPLEPSLEHEMGQRFGHDFSQVRAHTGAAAEQSTRDVKAHAYTVGHDIVFGHGQFAPTTYQGKKLLAHELTHVVQQGAARSGAERLEVGHENSAPQYDAQRISMEVQAGRPLLSIPRTPVVVARQPDTPIPVAQSEEVGASSQSPSEQSPPIDPLVSSQTSEGTRVHRIIVSCRDLLVALQTVDRTYLYRMSSCQLDPGSYEANVTIDGNDVGIHVSSGGRRVRFRAGFVIRPGQENPATLLQNQQTVHVDSVTSLKPSSEEQECFLDIEDQELIPEASFIRDLFSPIHYNRELWSHRFLLGEFGWITIALDADANVTGALQGSYGPGTLQDICLTQVLGRGRIGGRAHFSFPASIGGAVNLNGSLSLNARYLSIIPLTSLNGNLDARGTAQASGKIDAGVQAIFDLSTGRWSLAASSALVLRAALGYSITAAIAAKILTRTVWGASWTANANVDFGWRGGIAIRPDLFLIINRGRLETMAAMTQSAQNQVGAAATAGASDTPATSSIIMPILTGITTSLLSQDVANFQQDPARDGLSEQNALPLEWHKPKDNFIYPQRLDLPNAVSPNFVSRDDGPTQVSYNRADGTRTFDDIGVADHYWPYIGKTFQLVRGGRSDREKDRFRNLVTYLGFNRAGLQIDHVHELQFGELHPGDALDAFENLWPIDRSANASAGTRHRNQVRRYEQQLGSMQGRWFEIVKIGI